MEIVVAKYKEDVSWTTKITHNVIIYDKSDAPIKNSIPLENIGRESHTILYHIHTNYNNLADTTVFLQGNPWDHTKDPYSLIHNLNNSRDLHQLFIEYAPPEEGYVIWYKRAASKLYIENNPIQRGSKFNLGAQYCVSKETIKARTHQFWSRLYEMSKTTTNGDDRPDFIDPWCFEILWPVLFDTVNYPNIDFL